MKYILTFLALITLSSFNTNFTAAYDQKVNDAYSEYVLETDSQGEYGLQLVKGSVNGEIRYGFSFYSENSGDYYVRVLYNNKYYQLPTDSRGDIQAVALNLKAGDVFSIVVFRSRTGLAEPFGKYKNLKVMSEGEFALLEGKVSGHGQGTELSKLTTKIVFTAEHWFYIATFLIIITCSITVFIYHKRRQGLFNKEVRSQSSFNFREFISSNYEVPKLDNQIYEADYEVIEDKKPLQETEIEEEGSSYFEEHYSWARDEDESSGFNINEYLQNRGFITDYQLLSEDEKNLIMLELMLLKDKKQITKDEYLKETARLWKR